MERTVELALNKFSRVPPSLRNGPKGLPKSELTIQLASLYHHYYLDSYGRIPPDPNPAHFEYLQFLLNSPEFRLQGNGIGQSVSKRRHSSTELGQAFCRWFLHDHLGIVYFAHMQHALSGNLNATLSKYTIERSGSGDVPDYFCGRDSREVFIAEAKGRYSSISFHTAEFQKWRQQFDRVFVKDHSGVLRAVKGFVVATRFATESRPRLRNSRIYAEDPVSPGELPLGGDGEGGLGRMIISAHYSNIAAKLNQPVLSASLFGGFRLPDEILVPVVVWELNGFPLKGKRFVGGYFPPRDGIPLSGQKDGRFYMMSFDPLRLDVGAGTFFGVEESIFSQVVTFARGREVIRGEPISQFAEVAPFYSAISILRDGSIMGPVQFFTPVGQVVL